MSKHETAKPGRTSEAVAADGGSPARTRRTTRRGSWRRGGLAAAVLAGAVALAGCSLAASDVSFVVSQDVRNEVPALEQRKAEGELLSLSSPVAFNDYLAVRQNTLIYNGGEGTYALELGSNAEAAAPARLLDTQAMAVSPDGRLTMYRDASGLKLLDLINGEDRLLLDRDHEAYRAFSKDRGEADGLFADAEGNYVILPGQVGTLYVVESSTGVVHTIALSDYFKMDNSSYSHNFSVRGHSLYLFIGGESIPAGIYKIGLGQPGQAEPVMLMRDENKEHSPWFQVMNDGHILYAGEYMRTTGVFVHDPRSGETHALISKAFDIRNDMRRGYAFSLSPDESGLLIHDLEHERIMAGELSGVEWSNERVVLDGYKLTAIVSLLTDWEEDSKSVYVRLAYDGGDNSGGKIEKVLRVKL